MLAVITGMVGVDKKRYLEEVCSVARAKGTDILLCNVGDMMYGEAPDITPSKILDIPMKRLHELQRNAFDRIIAQSQTHSYLIINTHATFRWRNVLFPGIDTDQIRQLKPDVYICILDGVETLHWRLTSEHSIGHTLKDLLVWREEEIFGTEMLRRSVDESKPMYLMARGIHETTAAACYQLMFERDRKKVYLSFPMTHVMGMPVLLKKIDDWRRQMKDIFTSFDPGDLEDAHLPGMAYQANEKGEKTIETVAGGQKVSLLVHEVIEAAKDINSQIYTRDFMLIDQADMIVSFIPAMEDGRAALSSGVERELQHAHEAAKEVYVIWDVKKAPSVFVTQTATKVFYGVKEAIDYFHKRYARQA
jgi:adenylate kinase